MSDQPGDEVRVDSLAKRLRTIAMFVIAALGVAGVALGFSLQRQMPLEAGLFFAVGTSLLAYVVTAGLHTWVTEAASLQAMQAAVSSNVSGVLERVQRQTYNLIATEFPRFIPSTFFNATSERNPTFESEMRRAISESRHYYFRGVTGRHVPIWLEQARTTNLQVTVLTLHPQNRDLIVLYVREKHGADVQLTAAQIEREVEDVREQIFYSVVGLFDIRHSCPITVKLHNGPIFFRSEIFDSKCFISFYVDDLGTNYATTYVYNANSLFYASFRKDVSHCMQTNTESITLSSGTNEAALTEFLSRIGFNGDVSELRGKYLAFRDKFLGAKEPVA